MYDPFAQPPLPPVPGTVQTMATPSPMPPVAAPLAPNNALAFAGGRQGGMGGRFGRMLGGLQLPANMTAQDFLTQMQDLDWRSLRQGFHGDVRDWRQGGMSGARPTMQDQFAQYFGGTYGAPGAVATPGGGATGAPLQGAAAPYDWRSLVNRRSPMGRPNGPTGY